MYKYLYIVLSIRSKIKARTLLDLLKIINGLDLVKFINGVATFSTPKRYMKKIYLNTEVRKLI